MDVDDGMFDSDVMEDDDGGMADGDGASFGVDSVEMAPAAATRTETGSSVRRNQSFEVISEESLTDRSEALAREVAEVCSLPAGSSAALLLLRANKWSKARAIEKYTDDPDAALRAAGLLAGPGQLFFADGSDGGGGGGGGGGGSGGSSGESRSGRGRKQPAVECPICTESRPRSRSLAMSCGHVYCADCWRAYTLQALRDGPGCVGLRCPWPGCRAVVPPEAFHRLLPREEQARYRAFVARSFVDGSPQVKWCPFSGCSRAVRVERPSRREPVACGCGRRWCFRCCDDAVGDHAPALCEDVERWRRKAADESENVTWLTANTKRCPKCRSPIEKNGGCMHMTCTTASCGHHFCWLCRGDWKEHGSATGGYYACNKFDKNKASAEDVAMKNAKSELEHYMFYFHRYEAHAAAGKIAARQRDDCRAKEEAVLLKFDVRAADTRFMAEAVDQLLECRRVLQWSYVYGFHLTGPRAAERDLFEYLQENLEKFTNQLSETFETPLADVVDYAGFVKWREDCANFTRVAAKFRANFIDGVSAGLKS